MLISANLLKPAVIKQRNRANAISMVGQFARWVMEIWYIVLVGLLGKVFGPNATLDQQPPVFKFDKKELLKTTDKSEFEKEKLFASVS